MEQWLLLLRLVNASLGSMNLLIIWILRIDFHVFDYINNDIILHSLHPLERLVNRVGQVVDELTQVQSSLLSSLHIEPLLSLILLLWKGLAEKRLEVKPGKLLRLLIWRGLGILLSVCSSLSRNTQRFLLGRRLESGDEMEDLPVLVHDVLE